MADENTEQGDGKVPPVTNSKNSLTIAEAKEKLESVNEKVLSFSLSMVSQGENSEGGSGRVVRKQDDLITCLSVMRRLMEQAELESKRLKEEKYLIAAKINNSLNSVNREVEHLKAELHEQDKRLAELATEKTEHVGTSSASCTVVARTFTDSSENSEDSGTKMEKINEENSRLRRENEFLCRELDEFKGRNSNLTELYERLHCCEREINRAKETIVCMKTERKKLKGEKMELLCQMKQVYGILEDKESELSEFIKNYEQHMRSSDIKIQQLLGEKENWERERKDSLQFLEDLSTKLRIKETHLTVVESELFEVKQHLTLLKMNAPSRDSSGQCDMSIRNNLNASSSSSSRFSRAIQADVEKLLHSREEYEEMVQSPYSTTERLSVPTSTPANSPSSDSQSEDGHEHPAMTPGDAEVFEYATPPAPVVNIDVKKGKKKEKRGNFGSLSRLFSKGKHRKAVTAQTFEGGYHSADELEQYVLGTSFANKQHIFEIHKDIPMSCWKANMVLAWLEVECHMPMYAQMCYDNVKSGRVLLELSDGELESGLGISNVMHRRKLRLAIEEYRNPASIKYPCIARVDHFWVARTWIHGIGLSQYGPVFESQMIDGRLLNVLTKKDMEKYLNINKKFHQTSIMYGVDLLRMIAFDKQVLADRRAQCEETDTDPLVWTNDRVTRWCQSIDLGEYADNLRDGGVHGALMVIEQSFGPDEMAGCLTIHQSKNIIRRHLTSELTALIIPARTLLNFAMPERAKDKKQRRRRSLSFNFGQRYSMPSEPKRHSFRHLNNKGDSLDSALKANTESTSAFQIQTLAIPNNETRSWKRPLRPRSDVH